MTYLTTPLSLSCLLRWARDLDNAYDGHRIIGVGNSPAALTIAIDEIRRERGQTGTVSFLGYTQYYYTCYHDTTYIMGRDLQPDPKMLTDYAAYMKAEGVTADGIINDWRDKGLKTVFMDIVIQGCGLVSFYDTVAQTSSDYQGFLASDAVRLCALMPRMSVQSVDQVDIKMKTMRGDFNVTIDERRIETKNDTEDMLSTFLMGRSGYVTEETGRFAPFYPMSSRYKDQSYPHPVDSAKIDIFRQAVRQHMAYEKTNGPVRGVNKTRLGRNQKI